MIDQIERRNTYRAVTNMNAIWFDDDPLELVKENGHAIGGLAPEQRTAEVCLAALKNTIECVGSFTAHDLFGHAEVRRFFTENKAAILQVLAGGNNCNAN